MKSSGVFGILLSLSSVLSTSQAHALDGGFKNDTRTIKAVPFVKNGIEMLDIQGCNPKEIGKHGLDCKTIVSSRAVDFNKLIACVNDKSGFKAMEVGALGGITVLATIGEGISGVGIPIIGSTVVAGGAITEKLLKDATKLESEENALKSMINPKLILLDGTSYRTTVQFLKEASSSGSFGCKLRGEYQYASTTKNYTAPAVAGQAASIQPSVSVVSEAR